MPRFLFNIASICIGIAVFGFYFDFSILDPSNTAWIKRNGGSDVLQHYLGSYAFRLDSWNFPITKTTLINHPEGVSIIFTDSNPLLSLISKLFSAIFPPEYQFFGFWYMLCWALQSFFGFLLVKEVTSNKVYALLGGLLFCLLPTQIFRVGHANLVAFWLILWALYVFINHRYSDEKKQFLFFTIFLTSAMVHAYLSIMCIIIGTIWLLINGFKLLKKPDKGKVIRYFISNTVYFLLFLVCLWSLGYFYNNPVNEGLLGFGDFSMNLLSPFNPFEKYSGSYSIILPSINVIDTQYEGFQYVGLGIMSLFLLISFLIIIKFNLYHVNTFAGFSILPFICFVAFYKSDSLLLFEKILAVTLIAICFLFFYSLYKEKRSSLFLLAIPATICFLLALSNNIFIGKTNIFEIQLNEDAFYTGFLRAIRSSGRFFWVTIQVLLLFGVFSLYHIVKSGLVNTSILSVAIIIQLVDLSDQSSRIDSDNRSYSNLVNEESKKMLLASSSVKFLGDADLKIAEFALLNRRPVNNFYTVHHTGILTAKKLEEERKNINLNRRDTNLYIFKLKDLPYNVEAEISYKFNDHFYAIPPIGYCGKNYSIKFKKQEFDSLSAIIRLIKTHPIVVIAISDDAAHSFSSSSFKLAIDNEFNTNFAKIGYRHSYIAIFVNGKLLKEIQGSESSVEYSGKIKDLQFFVKSAGFPFGAQAIINIEGHDYSLNNRGINVVACTPTFGNGYNCLTTNFDTHGNHIPF